MSTELPLTFEAWYESDLDPVWGIPNVDLPDEKARSYAAKVWAAAVAAEREACAKTCEVRYMGDNNREDMEALRCAKAIRARATMETHASSTR